MAGVKGQASGGANRKTTRELKASGTYRVDRQGNRADLRVKHERPNKPDGMSDECGLVWDRLCEALPPSTVTKSHSDSLRIYCETWVAYKKIYPIFRDDPLDAKARQAWQGCISTLDKIGRQFGWTPQSLAGIEVIESQEEQDEFEAYAQRRGVA